MGVDGEVVGPGPTLTLSDLEKLLAVGAQLRIDQSWTVAFSLSDTGAV